MMNEQDLIKVMIVDDEPDIRQVEQLALQVGGGLTVEVCESGRQGLEKVSTFVPELILMDVMMPGMTGPTAFRHLRNDPGTALIPVIFMTAKVQPSEVVEYREMGALDVIAKPF